MERSYEQIKKLNRDINVLKRKINKREKEYLKNSGFDVTHRELEYIVIVRDNEGEKLLEALDTLDVSKSTWSNQIKTLSKKGLVTIKPDSKDKRSKRLSLTKKGVAAYNVHKKVRLLFLDEYAKFLTDKDIQTLCDIIEKLNVAVKKNNR